MYFEQLPRGRSFVNRHSEFKRAKSNSSRQVEFHSVTMHSIAGDRIRLPHFESDRCLLSRVTSGAIVLGDIDLNQRRLARETRGLDFVILGIYRVGRIKRTVAQCNSETESSPWARTGNEQIEILFALLTGAGEYQPVPPHSYELVRSKKKIKEPVKPPVRSRKTDRSELARRTVSQSSDQYNNNLQFRRISAEIIG